MRNVTATKALLRLNAKPDTAMVNQAKKIDITCLLMFAARMMR